MVILEILKGIVIGSLGPEKRPGFFQIRSGKAVWVGVRDKTKVSPETELEQAFRVARELGIICE